MITHSESFGKYRLNKKDVKGFLMKEYGIRAVSIVELKGGMINTSIKVKSPQQPYLLRIYRRGVRTRRDIASELYFCEMLAWGGVPTARAVSALTQDYIRILTSKAGGRYYAVLFQFLKGVHIKPRQHQLIPKIAKLHAVMHRLGERRVHKLPSSVDAIISWLNNEHAVAQAQLALKQIKLAEELNALHVDILAEYQLNKKNIARLPLALSHLDYDSGNILNDGKSITGVIDFDDLAVVPAVLDLGFSLWWWCYFNTHSKDLVLRRYVYAYSTVRRLTVGEKNLLSFFMRVRNLILSNLLFVNVPTVANVAALRKGIALDEWLKKINL